MLKPEKNGMSLLQYKKSMGYMFFLEQKGHTSLIPGSITETRPFSAIASCKFLHCKSHIFFGKGDLYNALHSGLTFSHRRIKI